MEFVEDLADGRCGEGVDAEFFADLEEVVWGEFFGGSCGCGEEAEGGEEWSEDRGEERVRHREELSWGGFPGVFFG